ncbi:MULTISPECIES: adenylate kinase [Corynebacterium]|uniref:adenylate kinase n=1 Tax=Corynebacterium TaxID=1716 RepID=UPI00254E195C|nr:MULTISPECIES: adenylate kinase [Corynebacterium]MDK6259931.1 adenylate kinase [Corynebacterium frankenforstense]MDK8895356.1 adenylate kinase [Corynebacterium sp. MSK006]
MRLVLLGPPGAGKGTQAAILSEKLNVPHISTGDLFRANIGEGTPLGVEAKQYIDAGKLVPTDVTARMVESRLDEADAADGFLLDGFPRTVEQAEILTDLLSKKGLKLDGVLNFRVSEDVVVERMLARGRADDTEETIRTRLQVYRDETAPLIEHYEGQLINVEAEGEIEEINARALAAINDHVEG